LNADVKFDRSTYKGQTMNTQVHPNPKKAGPCSPKFSCTKFYSVYYYPYPYLWNWC